MSPSLKPPAAASQLVGVNEPNEEEENNGSRDLGGVRKEKEKKTIQKYICERMLNKENNNKKNYRKKNKGKYSVFTQILCIHEDRRHEANLGSCCEEECFLPSRLRSAASGERRERNEDNGSESGSISLGHSFCFVSRLKASRAKEGRRRR